MKLTIVLSVALVSLCLGTSASGQVERTRDHSDWWSILNENSRGPKLEPSGLDVDAKNFEIAKLNLATVGFGDIAAGLGRTARIRRGDASTSREQACYVSADGRVPTYLIFELGEDVSNFYLFANGEDWKGRSSCARSGELSSDISTSSGLRLGLTLDQFKAILGQPDSTVDNRLVYSRAVKMKSTPERFERQRKEYPDALSDRVAHEKFDFYTVGIYIEGRFTDSKLSYLAVSKSGE
jgi:hypothetical protein